MATGQPWRPQSALGSAQQARTLVAAFERRPARGTRTSSYHQVIEGQHGHGSTIQGPPLGSPGRRFAGIRAGSGQRPPRLVLPRRQVPIVVCDLFYPVGSFDEPPGKTGLAHFLEHMLFKGTERFPKGQIDQLAFIAGGQANAETGEDCTHFWFMFPSDRWELALQIEADRMTLASLDVDEVEAERKVIGEERAREIESPQARLDQMHELTSYVKHPYRNPVLGWPEDVARISLDDLVAFYQAHYRPDGAVLVLAGDVEPAAALEKIEAHFGSLSRGVGSRQARSCDEPPQVGRRAFTLAEAEALPRGLLGWHTVPRGHRDTAALDVLADLLGAGRRSRLWQALVEQDKLATWVEALHAPPAGRGSSSSRSIPSPESIRRRSNGGSQAFSSSWPSRGRPSKS